MHALLVGNGEKISDRFLRQLAKGADIVAAADGGAVQLLRAELVPDVVIGDLDSLPASLRRTLVHALVPCSSQQNNDLEKALFYLAQKGITSCTLVGFTGGRMDFTFGNFLLLAKWAPKIDLTLVGETWQLYALSKSRSFVCKKGVRASLLPFTRCAGVSLEGFVYPLKNATLSVGTTRTLSNRTKATRVRVSLQKGVLGFYLETNPQK